MKMTEAIKRLVGRKPNPETEVVLDKVREDIRRRWIALDRLEKKYNVVTRQTTTVRAGTAHSAPSTTTSTSREETTTETTDMGTDTTEEVMSTTTQDRERTGSSSEGEDVYRA